jgi:hypothetical protein
VIPLPHINFRGVEVVPRDGSLVTIDAPAAAIIHITPKPQRVDSVAGNDRARVAVNRDAGFAADPVSVDLLASWLRHEPLRSFATFSLSGATKWVLAAVLVFLQDEVKAACRSVVRRLFKRNDDSSTL